MPHPFNARTAPAAAGLVVVASSAYTLLTADPLGWNFRIHLFLLLFVAVVALVGSAIRRA